MHSAIVKINGVPTEIISYGQLIDEGITIDGIKDVIIIITGNPGVPAFYTEFAEHVQSKLSTEVPIWIIGHTGHIKPPDNFSGTFPDIETHGYLYDMQGNIDHKIAFIKQYVPQNAEIHIIAHSIGSWFTLKVLKHNEIAERVVKCYLLFPTVERMAESPTGRFLTSFVLNIVGLLILFSWIFVMLPNIFQVTLIRLFGLFYGVPRSYVGAVLQLVHPKPLKHIFFLARDKMILVKERDDSVISKYQKKLYIYYGRYDGWTPLHYYEELKATYPDIDAHLCTRGFQHTFVLKDSVQMGQMIGDLIHKSISSQSNYKFNNYKTCIPYEKKRVTVGITNNKTSGKTIDCQ